MKLILELLDFDTLLDEAKECEFPDKDWNELNENDHEILHSIADESLRQLLSEANQLLETADDFYLVDGSAGLWNGNREYNVQKVGSWDILFGKVVDGKDDASFKIYKKNKGYVIEAKGYHHDGTNVYKFVNLEALIKDELYDIFSDIVELKRSWRKSEIIDAIEEHYYYYS